jgi:hypothetical protein
MKPTPPPEMTAEERNLHIQSCSDRFLEAYARFEDFGNPCDRDEACQWLHMRDQALREKLNDEGNDYFQVMGARHAAELRQETVNG